jgi:cytoskeleton protein RodZ
MTPPFPEEVPSAGATKEGFGARLRKGREARGLSVLEAADALRLSPRMIESIESEDLGALPPMLFAKGYLRSYAAFVGVDPSGVLKDFEARAATGTALQPPPPMRRPIGDLNDVKRGRQLASLVLLVVALSAFAWWWTRTGDPSATVPVSVSAPEPAPEMSSGEPEELVLGTEPSASAEEMTAAEPSSAAMGGDVLAGSEPSTEHTASKGNEQSDQAGDPAAPAPMSQEPAAPPPAAPAEIRRCCGIPPAGPDTARHPRDSCHRNRSRSRPENGDAPGTR